MGSSVILSEKLSKLAAIQAVLYLWIAAHNCIRGKFADAELSITSNIFAAFEPMEP
jgi:predicted nucleic-acid-binding Zn-ribbon protein